MLKDEVKKGWQLPLPPDAALELPGCEVAPLGMEVQSTIDERGKTQQKHRLTHDQTFSPSGKNDRSVNGRVDKTELTAMQFGKAFSRLIYYIAYLRSVYPDEKILLTKVDWKSAYRRIHLQADTAVKSCSCLDGRLLLALRMTFGGSPNPSEWSEVSEVVTDLANDLARRLDWDPNLHCSPHQGLLNSKAAVDNDEGHVRREYPFEKAQTLAVNYPDSDDFPRYERYIRRLVFVTVTKIGQCNQKGLRLSNCNQIWLLFVLCLHLKYLVTINLFNNHFCSFMNVYGEILIVLC